MSSKSALSKHGFHSLSLSMAESGVSSGVGSQAPRGGVSSAAALRRVPASQSQRATQIVESQTDADDTILEDSGAAQQSPSRRTLAQQQQQRRPWARLVALDVDCKHVKLFQATIRIGRKSNSQVIHQDQRISGLHCLIYRHAALVGSVPLVASTNQSVSNAPVSASGPHVPAPTTAGADDSGRVSAALQATAYLLDVSTNGTYVNKIRVGQGASKASALPASLLNGGELPTLDALLAMDCVRALHHGDRIQLVKPTNAADPQLEYLFEDLTTDLTLLELRQPELQARYDVGNIIGTGAFSQVRLCIDRRSGEQRCVKIVDKRKYGMPQQQQPQAPVQRAGVRGGGGGAAARVPTPAQLAREIDILKRVQHANIVNVCDVFESNRYIYLVLELARGGELFDRLYESGALEESRARDIFAQLLSAINYLHRQNIVHRDLKPENILFVNDHSDAVKVTDFGLARLVGHAELMQTLCGTPAYVAPEIIRAVQVRQAAAAEVPQTAAPPPPPQQLSASAADAAVGYSKAVDMWSLGIILYALLSGAPPFDDDDMSAQSDSDGRRPEQLTLFEQIARGTYQMPDHYFGGVSDDAKDLLRRLLVVDPAKRLTVEQALAHRWIAPTSTQDLSSATTTTTTTAAAATTTAPPDFASPHPKRKRQAAASAEAQCLAPETPAKAPGDAAAKRQRSNEQPSGGSGDAAHVVVVPDTPPAKMAALAALAPASVTTSDSNNMARRSQIVVIGDSPADALQPLAGVAQSSAMVVDDSPFLPARRVAMTTLTRASESPCLPPPPVPRANSPTVADSPLVGAARAAEPVAQHAQPHAKEKDDDVDVVARLNFD
jgi:serine/threonine protein kinase/pSer/pThr/pTyr-binding forkhead associated (FHA) protein